MTKRAIGILLVFLMVLSSISVTFAAEASQTYNDRRILRIRSTLPSTKQVHIQWK